MWRFAKPAEEGGGQIRPGPLDTRSYTLLLVLHTLCHGWLPHLHRSNFTRCSTAGGYLRSSDASLVKWHWSMVAPLTWTLFGYGRKGFWLWCESVEHFFGRGLGDLCGFLDPDFVPHRLMFNHGLRTTGVHTLAESKRDGCFGPILVSGQIQRRHLLRVSIQFRLTCLAVVRRGVGNGGLPRGTEDGVFRE